MAFYAAVKYGFRLCFCESAREIIRQSVHVLGPEYSLVKYSLARAVIGGRSSFALQQFEQFGARHQQLAAQGTAWLQLSALNQPVNAEIVDAKHGCGFLDGISQPFNRGGWFFGFADGFHKFYFQAALPLAANKAASN